MWAPCRVSQTLTESSQLLLSPRGSAQAAAAPSTQPTAPSSSHEGAADHPGSLANGGPCPGQSRTSAASGTSGADQAPSTAPSGQPGDVRAPNGMTGADAAQLANGLPDGHHGGSQPDLQAAPAHAHLHRHDAPRSSADHEQPGASHAPSASSVSSKSEPPLQAGGVPVSPVCLGSACPITSAAATAVMRWPGQSVRGVLLRWTLLGAAGPVISLHDVCRAVSSPVCVKHRLCDSLARCRRPVKLPGQQPPSWGVRWEWADAQRTCVWCQVTSWNGCLDLDHLEALPQAVCTAGLHSCQ